MKIASSCLRLNFSIFHLLFAIKIYSCPKYNTLYRSVYVSFALIAIAFVPIRPFTSHVYCFGVCRRTAITPPIKNSSRKFHSSLHSIVIQLCRMECKEVWSDRAYATEIHSHFPHRRRSTCTNGLFFCYSYLFYFFREKLFAQIFSGILINEMAKMWKIIIAFSRMKNEPVLRGFKIRLNGNSTVIALMTHFFPLPYFFGIFFSYNRCAPDQAFC